MKLERKDLSIVHFGRKREIELRVLTYSIFITCTL